MNHHEVSDSDPAPKMLSRELPENVFTTPEVQGVRISTNAGSRSERDVTV